MAKQLKSLMKLWIRREVISWTSVQLKDEEEKKGVSDHSLLFCGLISPWSFANVFVFHEGLLRFRAMVAATTPTGRNGSVPRE